jgi:hypothetical protein
MWTQFARRQQKIEKEFIPKMEHAIKGEIKKATDHFKAHGNGSVLYSSVGIMLVLKDIYHKAVHSEANIQYKKLKTVKLVGLGTNEAWNKVVDTYLMNHNVFNTVEQINETTKKRVLQLISEGIQSGKSVDQIVATIESDDIPLKRARLIVRTESVGAMNMGSMMGAISTGIMYQKKWVTAGDHRVRGTKPTDAFSHVMLNGELIDMEKSFNNGESIKFPGDKKGTSAGNFCNCRCCMSYVAKRDSNGRIMRYPDMVPDKPGMSVGVDGKFSDLLFQIIMGQIFGGLVQDLIDNYANDN